MNVWFAVDLNVVGRMGVSCDTEVTVWEHTRSVNDSGRPRRSLNKCTVFELMQNKVSDSLPSQIDCPSNLKLCPNNCYYSLMTPVVEDLPLFQLNSSRLLWYFFISYRYFSPIRHTALVWMNKYLILVSETQIIVKKKNISY